VYSIQQVLLPELRDRKKKGKKKKSLTLTGLLMEGVDRNSPQTTGH
jgi:hypothetical protein